MNKLNPEHLHLLLDEPIYVLNEHFEGHEQAVDLEPETKQLPKFKGENKKEILIIIEDKAEDSVATKDEEFLYKGLNALNILAEDVAILAKYPDINNQEIKHNKRITFSANPAREKLYQLDTIDNVTQLECHNISQIRNNQDLKVSFWLALKAMFKE